MKFTILKDGNSPVNTNTYLIYDEVSKDAYIIDATTKTKKFIKVIDELGLNVKYLILTHGHWDHITSAEFWRDKYGAKIVCHEYGKDYLKDPSLNLSVNHFEVPNLSFDPDIILEDNVGQFEIFKYYYTPGHSYDHLIYQMGNVVFSGDLIFYQSVGRTDLKGSKPRDLKESIQNILYREFDDETTLLPGHGPNTTVGYEKINNPWVKFEE